MKFKLKIRNYWQEKGRRKIIKILNEETKSLEAEADFKADKNVLIIFPLCMHLLRNNLRGILNHVEKLITTLTC